MASANFWKIISVLDARPSGDGYKARCPAHPDVNPSLSIRETDGGRLLFHCFAGCGQNEILSALREIGLWPVQANVGDDKSRTSRIVDDYKYVDQHGSLLFEQVRFHPKDFRPRRPDPDNSGKYIWNLRNPDGT